MISASLYAVALAHTSDGGWTLGIGDPTFVGWFTVFAYFASAFYCVRAWRRAKERRPPVTVLANAWLGSSALMGALGVNKQLDLQSLFTEIARTMVIDQGMYAERHGLQIMFIKAIGLGGVLTLALLLWLVRSHLRQLWLPMVGAVFIVVFVIIRASSFHDVDMFLSGELGGPRWNWVFELGGILLVGVGARRYALQPTAVRRRTRQARSDSS